MLLAGCSETDTVLRPLQIGSATGVVTTADLRQITERDLPYRPGRKIVCTEPPPDVAKALAAATTAAAQGSGKGIAAGGTFGTASAESLAELTGRVPGIIAARDILFRACEGYANGSIGDSIYSLAASRYGEILVTLMLAEAMQERPRPSILYASEVTVTPPGLSPLPNPPPAAAPAAPGPGASLEPGRAVGAFAEARNRKPQVVGDKKLQAVGNKKLIQLASLAPLIPDAATSASDAAPFLIQAVSPGAGADAAKDIKTADTATSPAAKTNAATGKKLAANSEMSGSITIKGAGLSPGGGTGSSGGAGSGSGAGSQVSPSSNASALQEMQKSFLSLQLVQPLVVACINEYDRSRAFYFEGAPIYVDAQGNPYRGPMPENPLLTVAL
jgi:hypothetical protein